MFVNVKLKKLFKENTITKYNFIVLSKALGNMLYFIVLYLLLIDISVIISLKINKMLGNSFVFIAIIVLFFIFLLNSAAIGINDDSLMIIRMKKFRFKAKRVFEIPFNKIRNITVKKGLMNTKLRISFISDEGKLEKHKYVFSTFIIGNYDLQENAKKLTVKLIELQKVIDKGDF